jgi:hypothetical protein
MRALDLVMDEPIAPDCDWNEHLRNLAIAVIEAENTAQGMAGEAPRPQGSAPSGAPSPVRKDAPKSSDHPTTQDDLQ